jgi:hypothetical protein
MTLATVSEQGDSRGHLLRENVYEVKRVHVYGLGKHDVGVH